MRRPRPISPSTRLRRLLQAGFLPEELPPPFVSAPLARYREHTLRQWRAIRQDFHRFRSIPEAYSVPRHGHKRKNVVIVNPVNQVRVAALIADNWQAVRDHISASTITEFRPIIDESGPRSIFGINFSGVDAALIRIQASYWQALRTDISRFYGSLYTHSVGWALHDKATVQANPNANWYTTSFAHQLDVAIRRGQNNQSVGIPIGPDTSRIFAELIAVGFEQQLATRLNHLSERAVRYVDDLIIGFDETETEDVLISAVEQSLGYFELDLNFEKTQVTGHTVRPAPEWIHELRSLPFVGSGTRQRERMERFFDVAIHHSEISEKDSVLKWAVKRSRSFRIEDDNFSYYVDHLLHVCRRAPACFRAVAQILIEANHNRRSLDRERLKKFAVDNIRVHAPVGHAYEVSWALLLCKGLRITLSRAELEPVFRMNSSVCALIAMDLNRLHLVNGGIDDAHWLTWANPDGLSSAMWLVAYEAALKNWWSTGIRDYCRNDPFFGPLLSRGIYFYDKRRNVPPARREAGGGAPSAERPRRQR